jgi:D-alanyl-lipoteichoic acid acyltransferase DltB (MBOAT superfamily)
MLFSSTHFILIFLPISFFVYFWLNRRRMVFAGKAWLVAVSLIFYAYWNVKYLPLMLGSILFNYAIGTGLAQSFRIDSATHGSQRHDFNRKTVLLTGILANLLLLGYYKYTDFFIANANLVLGTTFPFPHIALPLAISFFTFTQIAYLVDSFRGETAEYDLLNYALFVTFFPHLIAGPIVHHRQIMSQFSSRGKLVKRYPNILKGLFIFGVGLFKKVVIADGFAVCADAGFDGGQPLGLFGAWATSLAYTFQLYFDFSGYCDMAIGASLLFNVWLPINFNSPYKSLDIQDFWRRWHITLSNFLRDYLYIPLGGNRIATHRTYINLMMTFILGGLWHGASWMFVIWGALHGGALVLHRLWQKLHKPLPTPIAWLLTFAFVNVSWVFFRARTIDDATRVLRGMAGLSETSAARHDILNSAPASEIALGGWLSEYLLRLFPAGFVAYAATFVAIVAAFVIVHQKNSVEMLASQWSRTKVAYGALLFSSAMYFMLAAKSTAFLYFNF